MVHIERFNEKITEFKIFESGSIEKEVLSDFMTIFKCVTKQAFNNEIIVMSSPEIYKHTGNSPAAIKRKIIFGKNKIWIREMPPHEMLYELSHEVGHSLKPHLEKYSLGAEEVKAIIFQYCFVKKAKDLKIKNIGMLEDFVKYRIDHVKRTDTTYNKYYEAAIYIINEVGYEFDKCCEYIKNILKKEF
jgi:hypothetical protein